MGLIIDLVPWVLTHQDLSDMNILFDPSFGHITGVVDWADATIEPFDMAIWGLAGALMVGHTLEAILPIHTLDVILPEHERYFGRLY